MTKPNEPIEITKGPANLRQEMANADPVVDGRGALALEWTPYPGVIASFSADVGPDVRIGVGPSVLSFAGREIDVTLDQYPAGSRWSNGTHTIEARGRVTSTFVESSRPLVRLTTHLVNFPTFFWRQLPDRSWLGGVRLIAGGWEIVLQTVAGHERFLALKRSSGYCLTHVCQVKRTDDSGFSPQDAEHLLQGLLYFLSFGRAAWVTPVLSVGHDAEHAVALRQFVVWNTSPGRWFPTWMDDQHPQSLMELFPGFWARWMDDRDRETLRQTIYWYVTANTSTAADIGLILAQTALDHLAWNTVLQGGRAQMTANQRHHVSARIQKLLDESGIPGSIPAATPKLLWLALKEHPSKPSLRTGPIALTSARNAIVHPQWSADREAAAAALLEGRNLALWYLELCLLRWMRYTGDHQWRLRTHQVTGQVDPTPWASPERWELF